MKSTKQTYCTESKMCDTVPVCNGTSCRNETNCSVTPSCYDHDRWTNMTPNCSSCECTGVYNCSTAQNYQFIRDCFMGHCTYKSVLKNSSETCSPPVTSCSLPTPTLSPSDELVRTNGGAMSSDSLRTGMLVLGGVCGGAALVVLIVFRLWYGLQIKKDRRLVPDPWENSMVKVEKVTKDVIEMKE
ncbi:hypothetical protein DIPPA_27324 [Diplonema papillatum]|nr:hypothetical protein DIPPA_27324 [Diplonema papillatum]